MKLILSEQIVVGGQIGGNLAKADLLVLRWLGKDIGCTAATQKIPFHIFASLFAQFLPVYLHT